MQATGFDTLEQAVGLLDELLTGAAAVRDGKLWRLSGDELFTVGHRLEQIAHVIYAAQVHVAGEMDLQGLANSRSYSSVPAMLRDVFRLSGPDAHARVKAARQVLPQDLPTGGEAPPVLPLLGAALDAGDLSAEHVRIIATTMKNLPNQLDSETRDFCEEQLVDFGKQSDPGSLNKLARHLLDTVDPDGKLHDNDPADRMELDFGTRNNTTGLTPITGKLDDLGVATVRKAIDGLAKPRPEDDGVKDTRPAAARQAQGLIEALRRELDLGLGPNQGGVRPHLTIVMPWDPITKTIGTTRTDTGGYVSPAIARQLMCDADLIPAIMNTQGEVLDVGRAARTFLPQIRAAIALRDGGCIWPGCDQPPSRCEAHHINYWQQHFGPTSLANGCLLCSYHHHQIHLDDWIIHTTDGLPELVPPKWIDPHQKPRRNTLHRI